MDWLEILSGSDTEYESNNHDKSDSEDDGSYEEMMARFLERHEDPVFIYPHASYLTEFDDDYDSNVDPDFEVPDDCEVGTEYDIAEEFEVDDYAFDDTQVCFKGEKLTLGPCDHMCCKVWCLEPIGFSHPEILPPLGGVEDYFHTPMYSFVTHHGKRSGNGCTDKECKYPNATGILIKASLKTSLFERASNIFNSKTTKKLKSKANSSKISFRKPTA